MNRTEHALKEILLYPQIELCGSRFFGDATEDSDWDFITDDRKVYDNFDWSMTSHGRYGDSNTISFKQKGDVQLILVKSMVKRKLARMKIVDEKLDRSDTTVWNDIYSTL